MVILSESCVQTVIMMTFSNLFPRGGIISGTSPVSHHRSQGLLVFLQLICCLMSPNSNDSEELDNALDMTYFLYNKPFETSNLWLTYLDDPLVTHFG